MREGIQRRGCGGAGGERERERGGGKLAVDSGAVWRQRLMKLRHAMVCASNQNRSMEAHALLQKQGLDVSSYGTGTNVKLPGPSAREPNVYQFGTPYRQMLEDLKNKDPELYPLFDFVGEVVERVELGGFGVGFFWRNGFESKRS